MSDEVNNANEVLSPAQEKAQKQQRAWGKYLGVYCAIYTIASAALFAYVWFFMM